MKTIEQGLSLQSYGHQAKSTTRTKRGKVPPIKPKTITAGREGIPSRNRSPQAILESLLTSKKRLTDRGTPSPRTGPQLKRGRKKRRETLQGGGGRASATGEDDDCSVMGIDGWIGVV